MHSLDVLTDVDNLTYTNVISNWPFDGTTVTKETKETNNLVGYTYI